MQEILFRGKRKDDGEWVYGDLTHVIRITPNGDEKCIHVGGYDVDQSTIGQFTGILSSKGEKIFEGDIIEQLEDPFPMIIRWNQSRLCFSCSYFINGKYVSSPISALDSFLYSYTNIISNIHDNL